MAAGQACTSRSFAANGCWRPSSAQRRCVPSKKPLLVSPAAPSASASLASEPLAAPPASASPPALSRTPRFKPWFEQLETQLLDMGLEVVRTTTGERLDDDAADADDDQIATELERKQRELGTSACQVQHLEDVRRLGGSFGKLQQLIHQDLLTQMPSDPEALFLAASSFFIARRFRESLPLMQASMMAASEGHLSKKALAARHYFLALIALRLIMESDVSPQGEGTTRKVALDGLSEARKHELCTIVEQGLRESLRLDPRASSAYIDAELLAQIRHPGDAHARVRLHAELVSAACVSRGFWVHPLQRPMHFYPKLRSQPWWDAEQFSWASTLRSHFDEIRREVLHMRGLRADGTPYEWDQVGSKHDAGDRELVEDGEWRELVLLNSDDKVAAQVARNRRLCPVTLRVLGSIHQAVDLAKRGAGEPSEPEPLSMAHRPRYAWCRRFQLFPALSSSQPDPYLNPKRHPHS